MISVSNNCDSDHEISPEEVQLQWSEWTFRMLKTVRGTGRTDNIKLIMRDAINNAGTKDIIGKMRRESNPSLINEETGKIPFR
jgi:hypothetical protein